MNSKYKYSFTKIKPYVGKHLNLKCGNMCEFHMKIYALFYR